ncbi:uncharacterized protein LOC122723202 [Manihot esculenta]|uniref:Uncharacterized protein n=1 Tax=Manihot esculenta TaxID=3983 RepID=A0A2C9W8J3_MANES|nr:uncharacterized protein LOC122723202 [Manihot esculenta]OAY55132.1 hypothetical protein MANES_03G130000v8 [Manihot esculenta]
MKPNSRSTATTGGNECFYRYLKPGALAQLRNSKIIGRSHKPISLTRFSIQPVDSPHPHPQISVDQVPCLLSKIYGPPCLKRKKLMAARSVFCLNPGPSTPVLDSSHSNNNNNDSLIPVLNNDALIAH